MVERYICSECGKDFELEAVKRYTESHGFTDGPFEEMTCCPYCGGGYEEADICENCRSVFNKDDDKLFAGRWCKDCLRELITADNFVDFLKYDANEFGPYSVGYLEQFYFAEICGLDYDDMPKHSSPVLKRDIADLIKVNLKVHNILKEISGDNFFEKCKNFIMSDHDCAVEFADWLDGKEKKNG